MAPFRWIIMSSFLIMVFRAAAAWHPSFSIIKGGDEVTLSCKTVSDDQDQCDRITWTITKSGQAVTLFEHGQIHKEAGAKSDRLRVTEKCSLVIKEVTDEDAGSYTCKHLRSGLQQGQDSWVDLAVVTLTEHEDADTVTLKCSVSTEGVVHTVKWLYEGNKTDVVTTQRPFSATVTFTTSHPSQRLNSYELFECGVTNTCTGEIQLFTFSPPQSSGEKPWLPYFPVLRFIIGSVGLAALIVTVAVIWTRTKAKKTQTEENMELNDGDEDEGTMDDENVTHPSASI